MTPEALQVLVPAVTAIVGSIITLFIAKNATKKDLTMNDRKALSEDEKAFRQELRDAIGEYKKDLEEAREEIKNLSEEVAQLHKINLELTLENKRLQVKVDGLRSELQSFKIKGDKR
jgi:predicted RNase H-like nuclease (RuvC/YqgF family)